ncbi:serine/threonine protein kinase domain protein [Zymoseptoria brevis]|uniref:Serine/threonine protein kinase domain protein n=1 Tax=Zymoseptoria brevis TaxID=1047168 RepID=A0A0F4GDA1_9PEZI|nr:serine/threonine protein kinase domain protein [Zymoseptoria brevis]
MANSLHSAQSETNDTAYCTHECLLHFVHGQGPADTRCPNKAAHGSHRGSSGRIVELLREQLESEQSESGMTPLAKGGRTSELYSVRLFGTGHCLLAKTHQQSDYRWLQNEAAVYDRLQSLQGQVVPVFCGVLRLPQAISSARGTEYHHLLLLSWAGDALGCRRQDEPRQLATQLQPQIVSAITAIHEAQVIHGDPERRNIILDETSGRVMIIDFERSRIYSDRPPCDPTGPCQKKHKDKKGRQKPCTYCRDLWVASEALLVGSPPSSTEPEPATMEQPTAQDEAIDPISPGTDDDGGNRTPQVHGMTLRSRK